MTREEALNILGVSENDSLMNIKKKYRSLMLMTHPDVTDHHEYSFEASEINVAYEYLMAHPLDGHDSGSNDHHTDYHWNASGKSSSSEYSGEERKPRDPALRWRAPVNPNAYAPRDIYHTVEDADGERLGEAVIDHGRYIWIQDEDFSLFLKSLLYCSRQIVQESDERLNLDRSGNIRLLSEITYLLAQQYVDSDMVLRLLTSDDKTKPDLQSASGEKEKNDVSCISGDKGLADTIYSIDAMLELERRYAIKDGELLYPSRLHSHRLYVRNAVKKELGYISFKDDRLYYGIIPLFERRKVLVKMNVVSKDRKRLNGKSYVEVAMQLKLLKEDKSTMVDGINQKIARLLGESD